MSSAFRQNEKILPRSLNREFLNVERKEKENKPRDLALQKQNPTLKTNVRKDNEDLIGEMSGLWVTEPNNLEANEEEEELYGATIAWLSCLSVNQLPSDGLLSDRKQVQTSISQKLAPTSTSTSTQWPVARVSSQVEETSEYQCQGCHRELSGSSSRFSWRTEDAGTYCTSCGDEDEIFCVECCHDVGQYCAGRKCNEFYCHSCMPYTMWIGDQGEDEYCSIECIKGCPTAYRKYKNRGRSRKTRNSCHGAQAFSVGDDFIV